MKYLWENISFKILTGFTRIWSKYFIIGIKIKFADFQVITRDITLTNHISAGDLIRKAATECLKRVPLEQRLRLLGVRAGSLTAESEANQTPEVFQSSLPFP